MPEVRRGGKRRLDRVLAPEYSDGLAGLEVAALRARRAEAELEAAELSELLGLLHGRVEVLTGELRRRGGANSTGRLLSGVGSASGDWTPTAGPDGARRPETFRAAPEPGRADRRRRRVERLVVDVDLADVTARTDDELERVLRTYRTEEERVVALRSQVWLVVQQCGEELARRGLGAAVRPAATAPAPRERSVTAPTAGDDR